MPNLKINQTSLNILQKFYTYIFNQAVKNGNTHEIQKILQNMSKVTSSEIGSKSE